MGKRMTSPIVHYTVGRSGSAFISQLLFAIFGEENVWAGHEYTPSNGRKVVLTVRDFRDAMASMWRVHTDVPPDKLDGGHKMSTKDVIHFSRSMNNDVATLNRMHAENPDALIMRYHEFYPDNFNHIFKEFELHFNRSIPPEERDKLKAKYNFNENLKRSKRYKSFKEFGNNEWMHGNHVYKGKIGTWKDFVRPEDHHIVNNTLRDNLLKWGYKI